MPRGLIKLTAVASKQAAIRDLLFVYNQLKEHNPPLRWHENDSHTKIDTATQKMITWAKANNIPVELPKDWVEFDVPKRKRKSGEA